LADANTGNKLVMLLALGGLLSGLLTSVLTLGAQEAPTFSGIILGSAIAGCLAISGVVPSGWKAFGMIAVTTAAYLFSFAVAFGVQMTYCQIVPNAERWNNCTNEPASPIALFFGGCAGGFLMLGAVAFFFRPGLNQGTLAMTALLGAVLGGALGVAGWALRSAVGVPVWHLLHALHLTPIWGQHPPQWWFHDEYDYGTSSRVYSLYVVWQTGIALAAGILLRPIAKIDNE